MCCLTCHFAICLSATLPTRYSPPNTAPLITNFLLCLLTQLTNPDIFLPINNHYFQLQADVNNQSPDPQMSSDWLSSRISERRRLNQRFFFSSVLDLDYHQVRVDESVDTVLQAVLSSTVNFIAWLSVKTSLERRDLPRLLKGFNTHVPALLVQTVDHILQ